ncbi:short chain dehydrogenase [Fredinandcohnia sp. 179-A 10B2 NHS]|uniref:short chain dehydrogenase n=1 Tax=Fredinandcohnia sp. 179-A 10B2 NHS TaxID=3235176 RepID=UPI00399F5E93
MKILIIGATGTLGSAVRKNLEEVGHEIITAGRNGADFYVDITSHNSIKALYERVGKVDSVISTAGATHFGPLEELTTEKNEVSIDSKLKGQINLVLYGLSYVNDNGSFTLTTGVILDDPIIAGSSAAMANGGVRAFVHASSLEMPRGIRINEVSPNVLEESIEKYGTYFPGFVPVPVERVAQAYRKSVEGGQTGKTYKVY